MEEKKEKSKGSTSQKVQKLKWSLARCRKVANRFQSEADWAKGAPSSYKAAKCHGWASEIAEALGNRKSVTDVSPAKKAA